MKKRLVTAGKILFSVGLLVILFTQIDVKDLLARYRNIEIGYILISILILQSQTLLSSIKWKIILKSDNSDVPLLYLWKTYLIGGFLSLFLPSSIGGDFYRIYAVRDASQNLSKSTSSVVFDRLSGLFALVSISFIAALFLPGNRFQWISIAVYVLVILAFFIFTSNAMVSRLEGQTSKIMRMIFKVLSSFNSYRSNPLNLFLVLLIAFFFQFNIVLINKFYTLALGIDVPFSQLLVIIPLIYLTEVLPISINGFGVRESAYAFFFVLIGRTREEGLAVSLLTISIRYLMGSVGAILLLSNSIRSRSARPEKGSKKTELSKEPIESDQPTIVEF